MYRKTYSYWSLLFEKERRKKREQTYARKEREKNETNAPRLCPTPARTMYGATNMHDDRIFIIII
jgi:hypothetical protein